MYFNPTVINSVKVLKEFIIKEEIQISKIEITFKNEKVLTIICSSDKNLRRRFISYKSQFILGKSCSSDLLKKTGFECGILLDDDFQIIFDFYKKEKVNRTEKDKEYRKKYYNEHKTEMINKISTNIKKNKERYQLYSKEYYIKNRDKILERMNKYNLIEKNKERNKQYHKQYYIKNRELILYKASEYYYKNKN